MLGMSPPAPDNILLGTAPHCSLFWGDFPKKKPIPKPAAQPAPKGAHCALCPRCAKSRLFSTTGRHRSQGPEFCTPDAVLN